MPASAYFSFYPLSSALPTLPPKEEAKKYVILSAGEISHYQSETMQSTHLILNFPHKIVRKLF